MRKAIVLALISMTSIATTARLAIAQSEPGRSEPTEPQAGGREESLSDIVQLTSGFEKAGEAYFSPDMRWIIFQATPKGQTQYQMYVAKLKRAGDRIVGVEQPTQISPEPSRNTCGYFSADGKSLIFASTIGREKPDEPTAGYQREGGNYRWAFPAGMEIFLCEPGAQTWQERVEAAGPGGKADLVPFALTHNDVYDAEGSFSPDGKYICFTSMQNGNLDVYVMPLSEQRVYPQPGAGGAAPPGRHFTHLVPGTPIRITTAPGYDGGPFFSPDGKRLVYRSDRKSNNLLQIFVADLAFDDKGNITGAKAEHQLTDDVNVNWGPYWHPDGKHLIYATSRHGHTNYELYLMRDDGSHQTRITYSPGADVLPVFSPDGKYLMWTSKRSKDHTSQVFVARFEMPQERE